MTSANRHAEFFESARTKTHELLEQLMVENRALRALVGSLQSENDQLSSRLGVLEKDLVETHTKRQELEDHLRQIEQTSEALQARYFEVEQQNLKITNLYVASYQLHGTLVRDEVLANIEEILAGLIGTECYAIYEVRHERFELVRSMGAPFAMQSFALDEGMIGLAAASGETTVGEFGRRADGIPVVVVPMRFVGGCAGAIVIFGFLPQKNVLEAIDHELFDLLATHAGTSLYFTRLHASRTAGAEARA